jgi:hypothetical protein
VAGIRSFAIDLSLLAVRIRLERPVIRCSWQPSTKTASGESQREYAHLLRKSVYSPKSSQSLSRNLSILSLLDRFFLPVLTRKMCVQVRRASSCPPYLGLDTSSRLRGTAAMPPCKRVASRSGSWVQSYTYHKAKRTHCTAA